MSTKPNPKTNNEIKRTDKTPTFIDISTMVEARPGRGHLHSFHYAIRVASTSHFKESLIFGSLEEGGKEIKPVFQRKHFDRGLGTFFHTINLKKDLRRINSALDSIPGHKLLHFYEGGFRELSILVSLTKERNDFVALFNLFSLDPWLKLLSRRNPFRRQVALLLKFIISELSPKVAFTLDSEGAVRALKTDTGLENLHTYPLFSSIEENRVKEKWHGREVDFLFSPRTRDEKKLVVQTLIRLEKDTSRDRNRNIVIISRWKSKFSSGELSGLDLRSLKVNVINGSLSEDEYEKLFKSSRVVVLPYLDKHYELGSSGKVMDALAANSIPVAPADTSAGKFIKSIGAGYTFKGSSESLTEVLLQIDLEKAPAYDIPHPSVENSVLKIAKLTSELNPSKIELENDSAVRFLPFLASFSAWRWVAIHLVLSPAKILISKLGLKI